MKHNKLFWGLLIGFVFVLIMSKLFQTTDVKPCSWEEIQQSGMIQQSSDYPVKNQEWKKYSTDK